MQTALATSQKTPNFTVLAIHGKSGSGKTSLAELLCDNRLPVTTRPIMRVRMGFSDPIKEIASKLFQWDGDRSLYKKPDNSTDFSRGRGLLLGVGKAMRSVYPDVWAAAVCNRISTSVWSRTDRGAEKGVGEPFTLFVVDDLRLLNEVEVLKKAFPGNVRFIRMERAATLTGLTDVTEAGLDGFSEWYRDIDNNGSREALGHQADDILDQVVPIN